MPVLISSLMGCAASCRELKHGEDVRQPEGGGRAKPCRAASTGALQAASAPTSASTAAFLRPNLVPSLLHSELPWGRGTGAGIKLLVLHFRTSRLACPTQGQRQWKRRNCRRISGKLKLLEPP